MAEVVNFPVSSNLSVEQVLAAVTKEQKDFSQVLIIAIDADEEIIVRSSHMTRQDALWLVESGRLHALGLLK